MATAARRRRAAEPAPGGLAIVLALLLATGVGVGGYFAGRGSGAPHEASSELNHGLGASVASRGQIELAPAFSADELAAARRRTGSRTAARPSTSGTRR